MNLRLRLLLLRLTARRRGSLDVWDTARTTFRVLPTDLDALGHMNNGRYLSIMDLARLDLLLRSGAWERVRARGWYAVVAGQTITYRRSLTLGQRFAVESRILGTVDKWSCMEQTFRVGDEVVARAVVRTRFLRDAGGTVSAAEVDELAGPAPDGRRPPAWVEEWTRATRLG
ncbi:acyl-CoA thioesterase [Clavibacter michiganensis subsp. phaseoli]|uniref:Acyl-CoA thioesterase n=1 Tax=Clavibacter phaseoli TaxID=1734031 RepID=A0A8I0V953_9MICO|nr:acyl-CoA thioesterase [Clavibacter phaseoli]MBF4630948.1 acyl-CoA thioesterase [Clavibacter phaseoli]